MWWIIITSILSVLLPVAICYLYFESPLDKDNSSLLSICVYLFFVSVISLACIAVYLCHQNGKPVGVQDQLTVLYRDTIYRVIEVSDNFVTITDDLHMTNRDRNIWVIKQHRNPSITVNIYCAIFNGTLNAVQPPSK
jgi:hypothetical protein